MTISDFIIMSLSLLQIQIIEDQAPVRDATQKMKVNPSKDTRDIIFDMSLSAENIAKVSD